MRSFVVRKELLPAELVDVKLWHNIHPKYWINRQTISVLMLQITIMNVDEYHSTQVHQPKEHQQRVRAARRTLYQLKKMLKGLSRGRGRLRLVYGS